MAITPEDPIALAGWRRAVAELYARARHESIDDPQGAWEDFCAGRERLFRYHTSTPLTPEQIRKFTGLKYYPYDLTWRVMGEVVRDVTEDELTVELAADGTLRYRRVARVQFEVASQSAALSLFWLQGYGGGLFLPFTDLTSGTETYAGGRYLYDTIKGADLGMHANQLVLDFNYAYNPSCEYNDRWVCPLPPAENRLPFHVHAGEKRYKRG